MEDQTEILFLKFYYKNRTHLCTYETWINLMSVDLKLKTPKKNYFIKPKTFFFKLYNWEENSVHCENFQNKI